MEFTTGGHSVIDFPMGRQRDFAFATCAVGGRRLWLVVSADGQQAYAASAEARAEGDAAPMVPCELLAPAFGLPRLEGGE